MGALGSREGALHGAEVELHDLSRVGGISLGAVILDKKILLTQILLDQLNVALIAAGGAKILHGATIDGEVAHGGAILGSHVCDSCSVSQGKRLDARAEELDKLADDTAFTQHLDASEHKIGGSGSLRQLAVQVEADDLRQHHRDGLTEHDGLSLDTADTPAGDTKTVDHSRVGVGADNGVRVEHVLLVEDNTSEVLEVDLMDNTGARRNNLEVVESLGAPLQELESLAITREFEALVAVTGITNTSCIDLDGVINDEIDGAERVDLAGVTTETLHSVAHGGKIDNSGHATTHDK